MCQVHTITLSWIRTFMLATLYRSVEPKSLSWRGKVDISLIVQHFPSRAAHVGRKRGIEVGYNLF
jgi:hypothetical protein